MTVVAEAAHGREAVDLWRKHRPDVALLDLRMPVLDGVGATLLARGKSNKEIGMNLYISETTVKAHLRTIFTKLNVLSRTEAIAAASRRGLVQL
jgi:DNA-binding NarL/FixJ family response regulator